MSQAATATKQDIIISEEKVLREVSFLAESTAEQFRIIDERFEAIDRRFEAVGQRFDAMDRRFEAIEQRLDVIEQRIGVLEETINFIARNMVTKNDLSQLVTRDYLEGRLASLAP